MNKLLIVVVSVLMITGCTRSGQAERILEENGYTNIDVGGYGFLSCSDDDVFRTNFTATSPNGKRVSGTVCSGLLKSSTIRFD